MSAAPGRSRLRRVAFARLARIREEHALRLVDDAPEPAEPRPRRRLAPDLERLLLASSSPRPELSELQGYWSGSCAGAAATRN